MSPTNARRLQSKKIRFSLGGDFQMDFKNKRQMFDKAFTIDELIHHKIGETQ